MREQSLVAAGVDLGQAGIGLRRGQISARLKQLLVHLRSADHCQQLAPPDMCPDIEIPFAQVTVGTCVKQRVGIGVDIARQYDFLPGLPRVGGIDDDSGGSECIGLILELGAGPHPRHNPGNHYQGCED